MTRPLFYTEIGELDSLTRGSAFVLGGAEGRHAATVRRLAPGEDVWLADGAGVRADARVVAAAGGELRVEIDAVSRLKAPTCTFALVQALAKGDRDEQAIEAATELGVDRVVPWQAERSIVQWRGERAEKSRRKWVDTVRAAAKQSRRATIPAVADVVTTAGLAPLIARSVATFVLHEDARMPLASHPLPACGEVLVVVGPEGGISEAELATLTGAGGMPVRLGEGVLRSSTAGPAALAVLSATSRWA